MRKDELKHWVVFRLAKIGVQRHMMWVAIGLIVFSAATVLPQKAGYAENFENELVESAFSENSVGDLKEQLTDSFTKTTVQSQRQMVNQIMLWPQYTALREDGFNPNVQSFASSMDQLQQTINSPEYEQSVRDQINAQTENKAIDPKEVFGKVREKIPLFGLLGEWLWLLFGIGLAGTLLFLSSFVFSPLGMAYGFLANAALKAAWKNDSESVAVPSMPAPNASDEQIQKLKEELKQQLEQKRSI